ncbi:MFS transporter [Goodfellowiella coeruleoviolacea]|uniref:Multidrug efflux pump Tap n=1 Tax=Goodfellowiella coeruleoviolacea TaxID=334858 RepID=A0AAE3KF06_9PSEU|nr:MFS transporter [Goodfellowiella coeruleoviolacea]MCP2164390.1 Major Facilitator Superfamily protein [Goodfellowiella coeruleoviolacea]
MRLIVPLYLASSALSLLGNVIAGLVLPWLVLTRTGDAAAAGTLAAVTGLPMLAASLVGGVVIDRWGRRRVSVGADVASALSVAALPVVDLAFGLDLGWFMLFGVVGAVFDLPGMTARESLLPEIARAGGVPVERVAGLREGLQGVLTIVGPALVGGLMLALPGASVLWVTAACSGLAALLTALLPAGLGAPVAPAGQERRHWLAELREGVTLLRSDRLLGGVTVLSTVELLVLAPLIGLLLPAHLAVVGSAGQYGLVVSASAVGGVAGAVAYSVVGARLPRRMWFVGSTVLAGVGLVWLAVLPPFPLMLVAVLLVGVASGPMPPLLAVVTAERVPDALRGRVLGLQNAVSLGASPVGMFGGGLLVAGLGTSAAGVVLAGLWVLVTVFALLAPGLRRFDPEPVTGGDAAGPGENVVSGGGPC